MLVLALKGVSDEVRQVFYENLSERARTIVKNELDLMGPVRAEEVEAAQNKILNQARQLGDRGEIYLPHGPGARQQMVY